VPQPQEPLALGLVNVKPRLRRFSSLKSIVVLLLVVVDRGPDRVLGEHRAVDLDRREGELLDDLGVLDLQRFVDGLALEPLGGEGLDAIAEPQPKHLNLASSILPAVLVDLDLQLHDVAALGRADDADADVRGP
jgi:hypothetical protein